MFSAKNLPYKYSAWQLFCFCELEGVKITVATFNLWFQYAEIYTCWKSAHVSKGKAMLNYDILQASYLQDGLCSVRED